MQSLTPDAEVRLAVGQCVRTLATSRDNKELANTLQTLNTYMDDGPKVTTTSAQRAEFCKSHYTRTLQFLISSINADWLQVLTAAQRTELLDGLFLRGPPEQALLVLMEGIGTLRWVLIKVYAVYYDFVLQFTKVNKSWTGMGPAFYSTSRLVQIDFWSQCCFH